MPGAGPQLSHLLGDPRKRGADEDDRIVRDDPPEKDRRFHGLRSEIAGKEDVKAAFAGTRRPRQGNQRGDHGHKRLGADHVDGRDPPDAERPVDAVRNRKKGRQLQKRQHVCFYQHVLILVEVLVALVEDINLFFPGLDGGLVVFNQMDFCEELRQRGQKDARDFLVEGNDHQKPRHQDLRGKADDRKAPHQRRQGGLEMCELKDDCEKAVQRDPRLVDKKFLNQRRGRRARVHLLLCHHVDLHRLAAALKRRDGAVQVSDHADFEGAGKRIVLPEAAGEFVNQARVQEKVREHAQKSGCQPDGFKFPEVAHQRYQAVVGKAEVSQQTDGKRYCENVENGFPAHFLSPVGGHNSASLKFYF